MKFLVSNKLIDKFELVKIVDKLIKDYNKSGYDSRINKKNIEVLSNKRYDVVYEFANFFFDNDEVSKYVSRRLFSNKGNTSKIISEIEILFHDYMEGLSIKKIYEDNDFLYEITIDSIRTNDTYCMDLFYKSLCALILFDDETTIYVSEIILEASIPSKPFVNSFYYKPFARFEFDGNQANEVGIYDKPENNYVRTELADVVFTGGVDDNEIIDRDRIFKTNIIANTDIFQNLAKTIYTDYNIPFVASKKNYDALGLNKTFLSSCFFQPYDTDNKYCFGNSVDLKGTKLIIAPKNATGITIEGTEHVSLPDVPYEKMCISTGRATDSITWFVHNNFIGNELHKRKYATNDDISEIKKAAGEKIEGVFPELNIDDII